MTRESRAADIVGDASTMIVRPVAVTWSCNACGKGDVCWCLTLGGRRMLTKALAHHELARAVHAPWVNALCGSEL
jgi:hypothetical protein